MLRRINSPPGSAPSFFAKKIGLGFVRAKDSDQRERSSDRRHGMPRRILVKEVNWLGDLVMSLPALRAIRAAFPSAWLAVLVKSELAGFFDGMDWIDEAIPYRIRPGALGLPDKFQVIHRINAGHYDIAVLFPNSFAAALWPALARVPRRVGYATDHRGMLLTDRATAPSYAFTGHQSLYWLALVRAALVTGPVDECKLTLEVSMGNRERMRQWLRDNRRCPERRLIALTPGAAYGPAKQWPSESYAALIDLLAERHQVECVLLGGPSERGVCERVASLTRYPALNAAGLTTVGELIGLLAQCDGFAGNDSGAMHLAAALGIPAVGIFGSTAPGRTGPRGPRASVIYRPLECSPCLKRTCRFDHYRCLRQITPEEVCEPLARMGAFAAAP
ncbi:MAG: lipopolysaccharide heptosyltransferase II [Candidatus Binataceae bacterium]